MVVLLKEATMHLDVDTVLVTVYCIVDDLYRQHHAPHRPARPGHRPALSDSEVLTLTLLAQWQAARSERAFLRAARRQWRAYFPRLLSQSAFNRRARALLGVLSHLGPLIGRQVAQALLPAPAYAVLDSAPVPLMRRCRGRRHRLFADEAGVGHGGSDRDAYYGVQLLTAISAAGLITGFVVGPAATETRWLAEALLRWRVAPAAPPPTAAELAPVLGRAHHRGGQRRGPTGPLAPAAGAGAASAAPYVGDLGFQGRAWQDHWRTDYAAVVLTKAAYARLPAPDRERGEHWFCGLRQVVETVHGGLDGCLGLKFPRARTYGGLLTRLAAKVAAFNVGVALNLLHDRPRFAHLTPLLP
jgi:hypothetical protein